MYRTRYSHQIAASVLGFTVSIQLLVATVGIYCSFSDKHRVLKRCGHEGTQEKVLYTGIGGILTRLGQPHASKILIIAMMALKRFYSSVQHTPTVRTDTLSPSTFYSFAAI